MDRKEAIEILKRNKPTSDPRRCGTELCEAVDMAIEALQEPERKKGQWEDFDYDNSYLCTSCGEIWTLNDGTPEENNMNYCPNCGADMRKNEEELKQALAKELGCDPDEIAR